MCFTIRSSDGDSDVFLYCFDMGFHLSWDEWRAFTVKYHLECVNVHGSPIDSTLQYYIFLCSVDTADAALAAIKEMYHA